MQRKTQSALTLFSSHKELKEAPTLNVGGGNNASSHTVKSDPNLITVDNIGNLWKMIHQENILVILPEIIKKFTAFLSTLSKQYSGKNDAATQKIIYQLTRLQAESIISQSGITVEFINELILDIKTGGNALKQLIAYQAQDDESNDHIISDEDIRTFVDMLDSRFSTESSAPVIPKMKTGRTILPELNQEYLMKIKSALVSQDGEFIDKDPILSAAELKHEGDQFLETGYYVEAESKYKLALQWLQTCIEKTPQVRLDIVAVLGNLGTLYSFQHKYEDAFSKFSEALLQLQTESNYDEKFANYLEKTILKNSMAVIIKKNDEALDNYNNGNLLEAEQCYKKVIEWCTKAPDKYQSDSTHSLLSSAEHMLSVIYLQQNNITNCITTCKKALIALSKISDVTPYHVVRIDLTESLRDVLVACGTCSLGKGRNHSKKGEHRLAEEYFKEAVDCYRTASNARCNLNLALAELSLSALYSVHERFTEALDMVKKAETTFSKLNDKKTPEAVNLEKLLTKQLQDLSSHFTCIERSHVEKKSHISLTHFSEAYDVYTNIIMKAHPFNKQKQFFSLANDSPITFWIPELIRSNKSFIKALFSEIKNCINDKDQTIANHSIKTAKLLEVLCQLNPKINQNLTNAEGGIALEELRTIIESQRIGTRPSI